MSATNVVDDAEVPGTITSMTTTTGLSAVDSAAGLLSLTPTGRELLGMLRRLGFWVGDGSTVEAPHYCRPFPVKISDLSSEQLADLSSYWTSELSRVIALIGALSREMNEQELLLRRERARATNRVLAAAEAAEERTPTKTRIDACVALDNEVIEIEDRMAFIDGIVVALKATKEGVESYCKTASREITRRGDLLKAHVGR